MKTWPQQEQLHDKKVEQRNVRIGFAFAIAGTALFSLKSIFIKLAFAEGIDATSLLFLRMLIALPFYLAILVYAIKTRPEKAAILKKSDFFYMLGLGFLGYYLASFLDFKGLEYISAQLERLTLFTYPIMVALLSWLIYREKLTLRIIIALLLSYLGVLFLFMNESSASGQSTNTLVGTALVAGAALSFALYVIFSKTFIARLGSLIFTSIAMSSATLWVLVHYFSTRDLNEIVLSPKIWFLSFLLAIFSTLIPSFFTVEAIKRIGGTRTTISGTIGPVFTILLAVWYLGENFELPHAVGLTLVLVGVSSLQFNLIPKPLINWINRLRK